MNCECYVRELEDGSIDQLTCETHSELAYLRTRLAQVEAERDDALLTLMRSAIECQEAQHIVKLAQEWKRAERALDNTASDGPLKQASADAQRAVLALFAALPDLPQEER